MFLDHFPEIIEIENKSLRVNHVEEYRSILSKRGINRFSDLYEFVIDDSINLELKNSLTGKPVWDDIIKGEK